MRAAGFNWRYGLPLFLLLAACAPGDTEDAGGIRLHQAQRDYWQARHFRLRLDIYPNPTLAEEALTRFEQVRRSNPLTLLPASVDDQEAPAVKMARVGAMAALESAGLLRELGRREEAITLLTQSCRPDLPLGALVERRIRRSLAESLREEGRDREVAEVYFSLLEALSEGLEEGAAAWPDEELLALPSLLVELAAQHGDSLWLAQTTARANFYLDSVAELYRGEDAGWLALLNRIDLDLAAGRWQSAGEVLARLAKEYPDHEPWRAELKRALILAEHLDRADEGEAIMLSWLESQEEDAVMEAGRMHIRLLLADGRLDGAEGEILNLKKRFRRGSDQAELAFLRGELELRRDAWEEARPHFGRAAADHPFTVFGMAAQFRVATEWALRQKPRFAARALKGLFTATRRNTRQRAGSELAGLSMDYESRADSLLGTLPASEEAVLDLLKLRESAKARR